MNQMIYGKIRVQLLSKDIVRIEYGKNGFCDERTFFIPNRTQYSENTVAYTQKEGIIRFGEYELHLPERAKSLSGVKLKKNGKSVYTYKRLSNSGELPPIGKTPEAFALSDTPRIFIPEGGYSADRRGEYRVEENVQDVYLLLCKKDAKKLRRLYVELTGKTELVRLSALGGWNSKYYAYTEEEAKRLILDYEAHGVPLDVMVIDTDWRDCSAGWGYDINESLFPDMKGFFDFAHARGAEVMFNDHPQPVNGAQVFAPEEIAYREKNLQKLLNKGLDMWWYDRNWSVRLISPTPQMTHETLGFHLFEDITRHYWQKQAGDFAVYRRPVIMGNVDNIQNGCYLGISNSASHRYGIQWTGDIESTEYALSQEVDNLIKCTNNCIPYVNSDCGGHTGNPDKEQFIRWMQFGALSPIFRPHCTNTVERTREPWVYDEETLDIVREYNNLRYRLLPVMYKNARLAYETGEPIFKSLGFEYPTDKKALERNGEYMLGNDILVAPVAGNYPAPVKKENYLTPVKAVFFNGTEGKGDFAAVAEWNTLHMISKGVPPAKNMPVSRFSARFNTTVCFQKDVRLFVKCNDGIVVRVDGEKVLEEKNMHFAVLFSLCDLKANEPHEVEIEYCHSDGVASCILCSAQIKSRNEKSVYLPKGNAWLDLFGGKVYSGGNIVTRRYGLREMPLFVRLGALIPLAREARNTKEQKWDRLVCDYYPCKTARDAGYLYEDDTETTAYRLGQYRKSFYEADYCEKRNAYVVKLHAAQGEFQGEKAFAKREITFKCHVRETENVKRVTVNGAEKKYLKIKKDPSAFPLNAGQTAADGDIILFSVEIDITEEYEIVFYR